MSIENENLHRGDIWIVNLDPSIGREIKKSRPSVIISSDSIGILPLKLIAPITKWKEYFEDNLWHIKIIPNDLNGLTQLSTVDVLQIRSIDTQRMVKKLGKVTRVQLNEINRAIASIIEFEL